VYSEEVCHLFTIGSHHPNINAIPIKQNMINQCRYYRDISFNGKYILLLKNVRDKSQFSRLARQVFPEDSAGLYKAYLDATSKPHGCFLLDLAQDTVYLLRFPGEKPPITYIPQTDDTSNETFQLSHSTSA
jgi:hypothetical protein